MYFNFCVHLEDAFCKVSLFSMHFISGDGLNALKEQAGRASSVYKWLKENWRKLLVIIVALFALIFVIGIYRRCFSDSR